MIGQSPARPDGLDKVSGRAVYGDDFALGGMVYGATVRSPHPHARIDAVRWDPGAAPADSVCVTAADLPGPNGVQLLDDSWPILAGSITRHVGEPVALVAAPTRLEALRARDAVGVEYTPLEPILDLEAAAATEPLAVCNLSSGDVEGALAESEHVVEGVYRTGHQEHIYIECNVMTAWFEEDGTLEVVGSMQCPYYVHKALVHALQLPDEKVRVRSSIVGGGFGGKEDFPSMLALHAALLARATERPVRIAYDRHEDIVSTTKRHPASIRHRTGIDGDGRLVAMEIDVTLDGGAYRTLSEVVLSRAVLHATGPYRCPNVRVRGRVLATHTATNGAFRGFGSPQVQFAAERQLDRIARRVNLDPLEIRLRNLLEPGDRLPTGQLLDDTTAARPCLEAVAERTDFQTRWRTYEGERATRGEGEPLRGIGLSLYLHGAGFTGNGERRMQAPVKVRLTAEGRLEILTAQIDMGQGCATVFRQIAAAVAGVRDDDLTLAPPDTGIVPNSGPTVASRTTMIVGSSIAKSVAELRDTLVGWWLERNDISGETQLADGVLKTVDGRSWPFQEVAREYLAQRGPLEIVHGYRPPAGQSFDEETYQGEAYPTYAWGADVVEVEIDPDTLQVKPVKVDVACEVGKAIHPTLCAGQIEGGTLQSLGWGLCEEVKLEGGRYLNDRLTTYIIPTFKDTPTIDVELLELPWEHGPFGAKGVGELPMNGGAPAAVAAIENATGIAINEIPATPERIFAYSKREDSDEG